MEQRLIPDEHRAGLAQSFAKANARRQNAIDTRRPAIGTNQEPFLQTRHERVRFTENEARGEKDRRVVMDVLKDLVDHTCLMERSSRGRAQEGGQLLLCCRLVGRQGACECCWPSRGENRQQVFSKDTRITPDFHGRVNKLILYSILAQGIEGTQNELRPLGGKILPERFGHNAIAEVEHQLCPWELRDSPTQVQIVERQYRGMVPVTA